MVPETTIFLYFYPYPRFLSVFIARMSKNFGVALFAAAFSHLF